MITSTRTRFLSVLAAASLALAACGGSDGSSDTTASGTTLETIAAGKLTVCSDAPYEPFEFQDASGKWTGFDMDLMREIASRNDLELEVSVQPFDGIWLAPAAGTCDVVASSMTITAEREEAADFSDGYFDSFQSMLVMKENEATLASIEAFAGKKVAVQTGTTGEEFAKANLTGAEIQSFDEAGAMFLALESGEVDGVLQDFPINADRAVKQGTSVVSIKFDEGYDKESYGFAVKTGNTALLDAINEALADMRDDGTYDTIFATYFG